MAYIDKDLLLKDIGESVVFTVKRGVISPKLRGARKIIDRIKNAPTADVVEVKHGEWSHLGGDEWYCTNCGVVITTEGSWEKPTKNYCNECGAKMDGGKNDL